MAYRLQPPGSAAVPGSAPRDPSPLPTTRGRLPAPRVVADVSGPSPTGGVGANLALYVPGTGGVGRVPQPYKLPTELIIKIVREAVGVHGAWPNRLKTIRRLCQVSHKFSSISQPLLWEVLVLKANFPDPPPMEEQDWDAASTVLDEDDPSHKLYRDQGFAEGALGLARYAVEPRRVMASPAFGRHPVETLILATYAADSVAPLLRHPDFIKLSKTRPVRELVLAGSPRHALALSDLNVPALSGQSMLTLFE